jgi:hypothetical protein
MLQEAIQHLKALPRDAALRADVFDALAQQIQSASGGTWNAARGTGTDGSHIFLGRLGEGLVIAPDGGIFRGRLSRDIVVVRGGVRPNYSQLKPLA